MNSIYCFSGFLLRLLIEIGREGNLARLMYEFAQANPSAAPFQGALLEKLRVFLRRLRISTNHLKDKHGKPKIQVKAVIGLGAGRAAKDIKFFCEDYNKEVSVAEYFRKSNRGLCFFFGMFTDLLFLEYGKTLEYPNLPCVDVGTKDKPVLLPPEMATVLPGQAYGNKLMDEQTSKMILYACRRPKKNAGLIVGEGLSSLGLNPASKDLVRTHFTLESVRRY